MAVIRCPNCGKPNPDFLEVCQYCDARLHAADGSPVDSRAPSSAEDTLTPSAPPAPRSAMPEPEPEGEDNQPLGWMDRLRQMQAGEAAPPAAQAPADEPDWMWTGTLRDPGQREPGQLKPDDIPIPAPSESSADLPEWLRDLDEARDPYTAAPEPPAPATPAAAPASSISNYKLPITPEPPRPAEPPAPPITTSRAERPITPPPPAPTEPSPFEPAASDDTIPPRSRRKMTDWLNKLQDLPAPTPPAEPEAPVIPNTDADLPDWLKAMAAEAESPGSAAPAVEAATQHLAQPPAAAQTPDDELPDWLRALRAKSEPSRPAPGTGALQNRPTTGAGGSPAGSGSLAMRRNQELPEAMRPPANDETLTPRPGAKPLQAASDDMPDWLKGILSPTDAAAADLSQASEHPTILTGPAADAGRKPGGSRPIGAPRETPAPNAAIMPPVAPPASAPKPPAMSITGQPMPPASAPKPPAISITGQAMPPAAAPPKPPAESITNSRAERPVTPEPPAIDDTLPPPARRAKRLTDWLGKTPAPAAAAAPAEELPDWLKSLSAESAAKDAQAQPASAAVPAQELPDWLKTTPAPSDTAAQAPASAAAEPPPAPPAAPTTNSQAERPITSTPANDMPDWLKAMAPSAVDQQPATIVPDANSLADLPDWLQGLAPSAPETPLSAAPEPAAPVTTRSDQLPITPEPAAATPSDDLPDWLKELSPSAQAAAAAAPEPPAAPPEPAASIANYPLPVTSEPLAATPSDNLPDWLKAITEDSATNSLLPDTAVTVPAGAAPEPPAMQPEPPPAMQPEPAASITNYKLPITPEPLAATPSEDMPDWLKAITAAEAAAATETPTASVAPAAPIAEPPAAPPEPAAPITTRIEPLPVTSSAEDLPDWLKAITQAQAQAQAAAPELPATTPQPAMAAVPAAPERPASAPLADDSEDLPDWLKAITQASAAAGSAAVAPNEAPAPAVFDAETTLVPGPAVLAAAPVTNDDAERPITPQPEPVAEPTEPGSTLPPWLAGAGTPPVPDVQELPDLDEETLAWLSESKKAETTPEPAGLDLTNTKLPDEKPDWLDALAAVSTPHAASPAAPADIAATPAEDMPDWLRSMRSQAGAEPAAAEAATPDWLQALRGQAATTAAEDADSVEAITAATTTPAPAGPTPVPSTAAAPDTSGLTQGALPAWLAAMRPVDIEHPVPTEADAYEETLGVLAGMRGVLRAEPAVALPHKASAALQSVVVSDSNAAQVKILAELLLPEAAAQPVRRGRARLGAHAERWVIFALLLIALVLAQFQTQLQAQFGLPAIFGAPAANLPPESAAVFSIIQNVPAGKVALVAFDYDAGQSGELDPGAQALIAQLAKRGVQVVAVSQNLTGPAVAQQVLSQAATGGYVNLGYIPGGPVGLLQFASSPTSSFTIDFMGNSTNWGSGALASVRSLADFGLIVLVSGTPESTRAWIEQAQAQAPSVPMVAVVSAGAEPMLRPYYDDPDANSLVAGHLPLKGLVVGLSGAAAYEQAAAAPGAATALWPALGGGLLAAAAIILAGNVIFGILGGLRRRRA